MGFIEWATNPWGQSVPIHIAWFLIWVAVIAGLLFMIVHAIYVGIFAQRKEFAKNDSPASLAAIPERVPRHSLVARAFHWVMAISMLVLLFTAFLPKVGVRFDWVTYHWIAGTVLTVSILFHIVHASFYLDFWSIWPDKIDMRDAMRRVMRFMGKPEPPPDRFAKYPLENKLYHGVIMLSGLAAIVTGRVYDEARADDLLYAQPVFVQRHDLGDDVRASRPGGRWADRIGHGSRLLRDSAGEAPHYEGDDLRLDEPRFLSGRARSTAMGGRESIVISRKTGLSNTRC